MKRVSILIFVSLALLGAIQPAIAQSGVSSDSDIEVARYLGQVDSVLSTIAATADFASGIAAQQAYYSDTWRAEFASAWTVFEVLGTVYEKIEPPAGFEEIHSELGMAVSGVATVAPLCRLGILMMSASTIELCTDALDESTQHIDQATVLIAQKTLDLIASNDGAIPTATTVPLAPMGTCDLDSADRYLIQSLNSMLRAGNASPIAWQQMADRFADADLPTTYSVLSNNVQMLATAYQDGDRERIDQRREAITEILAADPCATPGAP